MLQTLLPLYFIAGLVILLIVWYTSYVLWRAKRLMGQREKGEGINWFGVIGCLFIIVLVVAIIATNIGYEGAIG